MFWHHSSLWTTFILTTIQGTCLDLPRNLFLALGLILNCSGLFPRLIVRRNQAATVQWPDWFPTALVWGTRCFFAAFESVVMNWTFLIQRCCIVYYKGSVMGSRDFFQGITGYVIVSTRVTLKPRSNTITSDSYQTPNKETRFGTKLNQAKERDFNTFGRLFGWFVIVWWFRFPLLKL